MTVSMCKRFAWVVALAAAVSVLVAPAALASGLGTPLTTHTQAMDGNLQVAQGSPLSVGYDFTMPGNHPLATVGFMGTTVSFNATCASGTPGSQTIAVEIAPRSYSDPANSSAWYPSGDQNDASTYQGTTPIPRFCDAGALVRLQQGGTFTTNISSPDTQDKVNLRWHYKDGTGGGWSGTYSATPTPVTVCAVTNTRTNLVYSALQDAQDAARDGDTLTVQNTCTGITTIGHDLTIDGVAGTNPTLDGNEAGTVLNFAENLTYTVSGLTIQHGHATNGGGVYVHDNSTANFDHDTVIANTADRIGGGFYIDPRSSAQLADSVVTNNMGTTGAGVAVVDADLIIFASTVILNYPVNPISYSPHWALGLYARITGGTYKLEVDGEETTALNHDATAAQIQTALEALSNTGPGGVSVSPAAGTAGQYAYGEDFEINFKYPDSGAERVRAMKVTDTFTGSCVSKYNPDPEIGDLVCPQAKVEGLSYDMIAYARASQLASIKAVKSTVDTALGVGAGATYSTDLTSTGVFFNLGGPSCVTDQQTGMGFPTLQSAQDSAVPGDILELVGTCHGQTTFTKDVTVTGPGNLDGDGSVTPVVVPSADINVVMRDLTITHGSGDLGGGIKNDGVLLLVNTNVSGNTATDGGGIYTTGATDTEQSSITNNTATRSGGGIYNSGVFSAGQGDISNNSAVDGGGIATNGNGQPNSQVEIADSTIHGNNASGLGGGIYMLGSITEVFLGVGSTVTANTASNGGGVFNVDHAGTLTIDGTSSVTGNTPNDIP